MKILIVCVCLQMYCLGIQLSEEGDGKRNVNVLENENDIHPLGARSLYETFNTSNPHSLTRLENLEYSFVTEPPSHSEIIAGIHIPGPINNHFPHLEKFWMEFKLAHNKLYSQAAELKRKRLWIENLIRIHQHNEDARRGHHSYYLRANHLSDMDVLEYMRKMVRLSKSNRDLVASYPVSNHVKRNVDVPQEFNWLDKGFVTPAWNQRNCGSCYAFSIASSAEGQYFRKTQKIQNLSVQQLVDCSVLVGNLGCHGGSLRNTLRYCLHSGGLMSDVDYPYKGKQQICLYRSWNKKVNISSYVVLPENDETSIEHAVATVGPVACSINASPYTFQLYHKGIYDDTSCSSDRVNHAMLIVGYTKDAWILKNWWGSHWGMNGYMYLRKGKNRCAVAKYAGYPVVDETPLQEALPLW